MKLFQSHKRVNAARINSCGFEADGSGWIQFTDTDGEEVQFDAPAGFVRPGANCEPGDYLVRYDGGYISWSPAAVFLDGYTEVMDKAATWQERDVLELNELGARIEGLRKALLAGTVTDQHAVALMQRQYKAMEEYHATLELRLRHTGVIDTETPPTVRETPAMTLGVPRRGDQLQTALDDLATRETPPTVRETPNLGVVTVRPPAGHSAEVVVERDATGERTVWTATERQTQSWGAVAGDKVTVRLSSTSTVAAKRGAV